MSETSQELVCQVRGVNGSAALIGVRWRTSAELLGGRLAGEWEPLNACPAVLVGRGDEPDLARSGGELRDEHSSHLQEGLVANRDG
jgi:hypothetical protein